MGILLAIAEALVRHYPNSYRFKSQWMEANAQRVSTLILGGSHTYYALKPDMLGDSVFSLANVTQHPEYDYWLLEKHIERMPHLRTVIMPVDESNAFDPPLEDGDEWHRCTYYHIYMGYPKHKNNPKYSFELSNITAFNLKLWPAVKYAAIGESALDCDSTGFGCNYVTPATFDIGYMERNAATTYARHSHTAATIEYNTHYLYKIAALCCERNIKLVLLTTPMWDKYLEQYDPSVFNTIHRVAGKCVSQYGADYRDYMRDERFRGVDFHDASHLSRQGAEKFTTIVKADFNL